jgi:PTS system fructose-specific IIC component
MPFVVEGLASGRLHPKPMARMKIVAVASSSASPALALMAAEALRKTAEVMGHSARVESRDSGGAAEPLSDAEIAAADVLILAADAQMDGARFTGKPVHETHVAEAIRHTREVLDAALALVAAPTEPAAVTATTPAPAAVAEPVPAANAGKRIVGITA